MEDREENTGRSILASAGMFALGMYLGKNYYKKTLIDNFITPSRKTNMKDWAALGAAFSAIPFIFSDNKTASLITTGVLTFGALNSKQLTNSIINSDELFNGLFVPMMTVTKKLAKTQNDIKEWAIESRQKIMNEKKENEGYMKGILESISDFSKAIQGQQYKKSKAFYHYKENASKLDEFTFEDILRLGKKMPKEFNDYVIARRKFENNIANSKIGTNITSTLGYFSKLKNGKLELDPVKFLNENANNIRSQIDILNTIPKAYKTGTEGVLTNYLKKSGMMFVDDAIKANSNVDKDTGRILDKSKVTYKQFIDKYNKDNALFKAMGSQANAYFDSEGKVKYLDVLGDQVFSDNLIMNKNGRIFDATWLKPSNYVLDALKIVDSSFKPFFKTLPFGDNNQFPILDTLGIDTKIYNSIHGDQMSKLYANKNDNIDLQKTYDILSKQINTMKNVNNKYWREEKGYKTISDAFKELNKLEDVYNPRLRTESQVNEAIRQLEIKQTSVADMLEKTGGTLKRSNLTGLQDDMDKAYERYFVHIDHNNKDKITLMKRTENGVNSIFYNNKMYLKKNGVYEEQKGEYLFDLSKQTRIIQAKRNNSYYTTQANRAGRYVEEDDAPINFNFDDFKDIFQNKGTSEALSYMKKSDINFIPILGRNGYKDSDNFYDNVKEPVDRVMNYLKSTDKKDRNVLEMAGLALGINKQSQSFYNKYEEEVDFVFDKMIEKYNVGLKELNDMMKSNNAFRNRYLKISGRDNIVGSENVLDKLTVSKIKNITGDTELSDNINDFLNMKKSFEISGDKYGVVDEYRSFRQVNATNETPLQKKFGSLYNPKNFKEDLIINTFNQHESYKEFTDRYGDLFSNNIMFGKENLFNKNRITNINLNAPSIVQKAFSNVDIKKLTRDNVGEYFDGKNKVGTNLGMFIAKGFESFENSLSVLGIPKLNPENMRSTTDYVSALMKKRVAPMIGAYMTYSMINSFVDMALPDSTPVFGEGLTAAAFKAIAAARMTMQIAINSIGMGYVFRKLEEMFPGMITDNGILSPLQLSYTNEEMYDILYNGKEVEDRKNRFWFSSGRQKFEGGEIQTLRPSLLFLGQHRTAGIYENKVQRFFRQDFLPTKLAWTIVDPYMEERINKDKRPVAKSGDVFNSELPIIGGYVNLLGRIIKPTKYYNEEEWKVENGVMINPEYDGQENTPRYINYDTSWKLTQATFKAYEDIKAMMGMRGYIIGQAISTVFGTDNPIENNVRLETLNDGQNAIDRFNALNLGGMFGTTEPIRRILGDKPIEATVSPIRNTYMPDWMPQHYFKNVSHGNVYNEMPFGEFILPGEVYEKYNKLHPDETGKYGIADRLKILSKVAPYSKEFRHTRDLALRRINDMSSEEKQIVYQSLSYAEKWRQRDVDVNHRQEVDITGTNVTIKRMEGLTEFYGTDNKRYKLTGIGADYLQGRSGSEITRQMEMLQEQLRRGTTLNGIIASDPIQSVKTDNAGEYIELYVPEFDKYTKLQQETYLRHSYKSDINITDYLMNTFKNAKKPGYLEKIWGGKDAYHRYYYENILDPTFKNWETPVASFINPILDTASASTKGYIGSMNIALRVGEFGDPVLPLMTTMSYAKGMLFGPNEVERVRREDELKNMIEYAKSQLPQDDYRGNFNSSIYNMSENDGLSKMKNYLTMTERKYLDDLVNETDEDTRQQIYDVSSNRMKKVLDTLWKRQAEYNGGSYEGGNVELPDMSDIEMPEYNATNDTAYNDALFKLESGFDLTSYEQKSVNLYGTKHLKEYKRETDIAEYIDTMLKGKAKHKVLSTTLDNDIIVYQEKDR